MSPVPSTSALGLDLGLAPPFTAPSSSVSAKGAFAVESYTPTEGFAGILLTVNLTCFDTILPSINDQDQADDFRLIINDKKLCSRAEHGSNGNVTLRALLSTSLASLSGLVPMSLHLHRNGTLFDHCNFGYFNFVAVPMSTYFLVDTIFSHLTHSLKPRRHRRPPYTIPQSGIGTIRAERLRPNPRGAGSLPLLLSLPMTRIKRS